VFALKCLPSTNTDDVIISGDHDISLQAIGRQIELPRAALSKPTPGRILSNADASVAGWKHLMDGRAGTVLGRMGASCMFARCSPANKATVIETLQQSSGAVVAYVGTASQDGPAFAAADVSIVMPGAAGTTKSEADLLLLSQDLRCLAATVRASAAAVDGLVGGN
jgi:magnesium-transporting ATPase (P-type)